MSDFKEKLNNARSKLLRRASNFSGSASSPATSGASSPRKQDQHHYYSFSRRKSSTPSAAINTSRLGQHFAEPDSSDPAAAPADVAETEPQSAIRYHLVSPILTVESPSPDLPVAKPAAKQNTEIHPLASSAVQDHIPVGQAVAPEQTLQNSPPNSSSIHTSPKLEESRWSTTLQHDYFGRQQEVAAAAMSRRKVWIKRSGASPTLVQIAHDDLVDDVRDMVLRKYANSLGRTFDAPDVSLRIVPRERGQAERILGPEEPMGPILDAYFPGGQNIEEALLIDVPRRRTPQPSPRIMNYNAAYLDDNRPAENGTGYFPPMPATSPHPSQSVASHESRQSYHQEPHSHAIAVLETGQLPVLPSPRERRGAHRPKYSRQHTSSPTLLPTAAQPVSAPTSRQQYTRIEPETRRTNTVPGAAPLVPTPPAQEIASKAMSASASTPPLDRINSPRPAKNKKSRKVNITKDVQQQPQQQNPEEQQVEPDRKDSHARPQMPLSLIEATVPPINVLIVEDNPINLRLLEMFTKRLKVRWQTAVNGREAVTKWRAGGFHLVLMDIQLPIMSGLEATKEIRRLERVNGIGVFAKTQDEDRVPASEVDGDAAVDSKAAEGAEGDDKLSDAGLFKSPVIIVALTASSLQSDRHEALAAGCNDFLTKVGRGDGAHVTLTPWLCAYILQPVHFPYLERKVMEWGCMQALIDFDGWRKWKDLAAAAEEEKKKEEDLDPELKAKREKKEAKRAALMAKMGQG